MNDMKGESVMKNPAKTMRLCVITAVAGAAASVTLAGPVAAQTTRTAGPPPSDPVMAWAERLMPANKFLLNSMEDVELIRYKTPRDFELCNAGPDSSQIDSASRTVPLLITWDGETAMVAPGNCFATEAMSVKVRPAQALPEGVDLVGTFHVSHK